MNKDGSREKESLLKSYEQDHKGPPPDYTENDIVVTVAEDVQSKKSFVDPWAVVEVEQRGKKWSEKTSIEKAGSVILLIIKLVILLGLLYLFICSLGFLSDAFKMLGGKAAGEAFSQSEILNNPVTCLMLGVLATVLLQSSSTTTSIVVAMVAEGVIYTEPAIYIVMGANIGTSVTNTIVSMGQAVERDEFRRAFGGATVHDMFNWLCVLILLPIEAIVAAIPATRIPVNDLEPFDPNATKVNVSMMDCGMLCHLTRVIIKPMVGNVESSKTKKDLLKVITKPFTSLVAQVDKNAITMYARSEVADTILKKGCKDANKTKYICGPGEEGAYLFGIIKRNTGMSDEGLGALLLVISLILLIICLICIVKLLHSMLRGPIANLLKKFVNSDLPGPFKFLTGYIAILIGAGLTILVQSSSIFTSAITPLVGIGVLHLDRMFPLTLGANIGTTVTAILTSLAQDGEKIPLALQVALCHLFFNIIGVIIWYPIPAMRAIPVSLAKSLGNTTANHRWFALVYLFLMFFILPAACFGLSIAGWPYLVGIGGTFLLFFVTIVVINILQRKKPKAICCPKLRTWEWCPRPLHTLSFYDEKCICCRKDNDEDKPEAIEFDNR